PARCPPAGAEQRCRLRQHARPAASSAVLARGGAENHFRADFRNFRQHLLQQLFPILKAQFALRNQLCQRLAHRACNAFRACREQGFHFRRIMRQRRRVGANFQHQRVQFLRHFSRSPIYIPSGNRAISAASSACPNPAVSPRPSLPSTASRKSCGVARQNSSGDQPSKPVATRAASAQMPATPFTSRSGHPECSPPIAGTRAAPPPSPPPAAPRRTPRGSSPPPGLQGNATAPPPVRPVPVFPPPPARSARTAAPPPPPPP